MRRLLKKPVGIFIFAPLATGDSNSWDYSGVAVVISIDLALESALHTFKQTTQALSGKASYRIIASDGGWMKNYILT